MEGDESLQRPSPTQKNTPIFIQQIDKGTMHVRFDVEILSCIGVLKYCDRNKIA